MSGTGTGIGTSTGTGADQNPPVERAPDEVRLPQGCLCALRYRDPADAESFTWRYLKMCPVAPEDHTEYWRPYFQFAFSAGGGAAQAPGGGRIIIDRGRVCYPVVFTRGFFVLTSVGRRR